MSLVPAICTQCGAQIKVDSSKEAAICEHCGTTFIVEKAINNYNTYVTNNNSFAGSTIVINSKPKSTPFIIGKPVSDDADFFKKLQDTPVKKEKTEAEKIEEDRIDKAKRVVSELKSECEWLTRNGKERKIQAKIQIRQDCIDYDWGGIKKGNIEFHFRKSYESEEEWICWGSTAELNDDNQTLLTYIRRELKANGFPENCITILDEDALKCYNDTNFFGKPRKKYKPTGRKTNAFYIDLAW